MPAQDARHLQHTSTLFEYFHPFVNFAVANIDMVVNFAVANIDIDIDI
jgi:hypothetical protein